MAKGLVNFGELYLDSDTDPKMTKGSDYILNTVYNSDGRHDIAVNSKGNELILQIPGITNIGPDGINFFSTCKDLSRNRIVFFARVYCSYNATFATWDFICYFDISTEITSIVLALNSNNGGIIGTEANLDVESCVIGDFLIWTGHNNPVRSINYIRAYNYTHNVNPEYAYHAIDEQTILLYKKPYDKVIQITKNTLGSQNYPYGILEKSFQWAVRYIYGDNQKSVINQISPIKFTSEMHLPNGQKTLDEGTVSYGLSFMYFTNDVIKCELLVRNNELSDWYSYDTIITPITKSFTANKVASSTNISVTKDIYDQIPIGNLITVDSASAKVIGKSIDVSNNYLLTLSGLSVFVSSGSVSVVVLDTIEYLYDDTKLRLPVDQTELDRPFDFIPDTASKLTPIENNRILLSNFVEGKDPVKINNTYDIVYTPVVDMNYIPCARIYLVSSGSDTFGQIKYPELNSAQIAGLNSGYEVELELFIRYVNESTSVSGTMYDSMVLRFTDIRGTKTILDVMNFFRNQLAPTGNATAYVDTSGVAFLGLKLNNRILNVEQNYTKAWKEFAARTKIPNNVNIEIYDIKMKYLIPGKSYKTLKGGDSYNGGVVYFDRNLKHGTINKFEKPIDVPNYNINNQANIRVKLRNTPPDWAYYYCLAFSKRVKKEFFIDVQAKKDVDYYFGVDGYLRIKVQGIINQGNSLNHNSIISNYEFKQGDKARIIGYAERTNYLSGGVVVSYQYGDFVPLVSNSTYINDVPIIGIEYPSDDSTYVKDTSTGLDYILDANGNKVYDTASQYVIVAYDGNTTLEGSSGSRLLNAVDFIEIEIYREKKVTSENFYYHEDIFEIGDVGGLYHKVPSYVTSHQDQSPSDPIGTPAIITSNFGDTYVKTRDCKYIFPCQDDNYSDYYPSAFYGLGMPNIYDENQKKTEYVNGLRYSGQLIQQTKVNELNRFYGKDFMTLKLDYGAITKAIEVGDTLKVIHPNEETSIYIGRTETKNADGSSNLITKDSVLGTINYLGYGNGTVHPKSVVLNKRNIYYLDVINGYVVRSSPNGREKISMLYNMHSHFKQLCKSIVLAGVNNIDVVGAFDEENNMYLLTIKPNIYGIEPETIAFYDTDKPKWATFFSFIPDSYEWIGNYLVSFKGNYGYKHNSNNVPRMNFYGVQYTWVLSWIFNAVPVVKKVFRALNIKSSSIWNVNSIDIEKDATYKNGMHSVLDPTKFKLKEGMFCASYKRNMLTHSSVPNNFDLVNGDALRGHYIKHQMTNTQTDEQWLMDAEIEYNISNNI